MAALASVGQQADQHDLSSITSSSLNTTVITKLEVSDRYVPTYTYTACCRRSIWLIFLEISTCYSKM